MEPILSTSHSICNGARSCAHALKTIPLAPIYSLIKQIIPSLYQQSSTWDSLQSIILIYHKCPTYKRVPFFFFVCFIFIVHFLWACENLHDFSFVHLSHSFFNRFQPNLCQHFSHVRYSPVTTSHTRDLSCVVPRVIQREEKMSRVSLNIHTRDTSCDLACGEINNAWIYIFTRVMLLVLQCVEKNNHAWIYIFTRSVASRVCAWQRKYPRVKISLKTNIGQ